MPYPPLLCFVAVIALATSLCAQQKEEEPKLPAAVLKDIEEISRKQGAALKNAKVIVQRAFVHEAPGYKSNRKQQWIAVDVQFTGFTEHFDLDDVDILDADTGENFGSGPDIKPLREDGTVHLNSMAHDGEEESIRVALLYRVPHSVKSIKLRYWDQDITPKATPLTEDKLKYRAVPLLAGLEKWPYPDGKHGTDDSFQRGDWLLVNHSVLVDGGACRIDLATWPPKIEPLPWNMVQAIEPLPIGGYAMITRTREGEGVRFWLWKHPEGPVGVPMPKEAAEGPKKEALQGVAILGKSAFAFTKTRLYRNEGGTFMPVAKAEGAKSRYLNNTQDYTHGTVPLGGKQALLWDGDVWELVDSKLTKTFELDVQEPYDFAALPWGDEGFYFLEDGRVYRIRRGGQREQVMRKLEGVESIYAGPQGTIIFRSIDDDILVGLWRPDDDTYALVRQAELGNDLPVHHVNNMHYSPTTKRFYVVCRDELMTFPEEVLTKRRD